MFFIVTVRKKLLVCIVVFIIVSVFLLFASTSSSLSIFSDNEKITEFVESMMKNRNQSVLDNDCDALKLFYNREKTLSTWAYDHQVKKVKYLNEWAEKQGVKFTKIISHIEIRRVNKKDNGYTINFSAFTKYCYVYNNDSERVNRFKIGSYHSMDVFGTEENLLIEREWYTDPFADSMNLDLINTDNITNYILSGDERDFSDINERRKGALEYADKYCGTKADQSLKFIYNDKYKNYNYSGGDCANFASQVLYEGGKFKKNYTWGYGKEGTKAWVNANAFKNYILYSGRASIVAQGKYDKVLKASYLLKPGDIIGYGKKGKVDHVSVVSGADSKGYTLVNCHNADRYKVPWDLGWSDSSIKFWLIHVHY